jgi:L-aminopeptidase/D-esterase-like protein
MSMRARDHGLELSGTTGELNAIIDVAGVEVGYTMLVRGEDVRAGVIPCGQLDPFYDAVVEAVEDAVLNVLFAAETMVGRKCHRSPGMPVAAVLELIRSR